MDKTKNFIFYSLSQNVNFRGMLLCIAAWMAFVILEQAVSGASFVRSSFVLHLRDQGNSEVIDHEWSGWNETRTPLQDVTHANQGSPLQALQESCQTLLWRTESEGILLLTDGGWYMITFQAVWWISKQPTSLRTEMMIIGRIMDMWHLRGYCAPNQKLACFVLLSQNYQYLFENYSKNICILKQTVQGTEKLHWHSSRPSSFYVSKHYFDQ